MPRRIFDIGVFLLIVGVLGVGILVFHQRILSLVTAAGIYITYTTLENRWTGLRE